MIKLFSSGDPTAFGNFQPPDSVIQAIQDSLIHPSCSNYGPVIGFYEARKAVAEYSRHQRNVKPEDVILCSGCAHAIDLVITTLAHSGQNILVPRPGHMVYKTVAEGLGIELKYLLQSTGTFIEFIYPYYLSHIISNMFPGFLINNVLVLRLNMTLSKLIYTNKTFAQSSSKYTLI